MTFNGLLVKDGNLNKHRFFVITISSKDRIQSKKHAYQAKFNLLHSLWFKNTINVFICIDLNCGCFFAKLHCLRFWNFKWFLLPEGKLYEWNKFCFSQPIDLRHLKTYFLFMQNIMILYDFYAWIMKYCLREENRSIMKINFDMSYQFLK